MCLWPVTTEAQLQEPKLQAMFKPHLSYVGQCLISAEAYVSLPAAVFFEDRTWVNSHTDTKHLLLDLLPPYCTRKDIAYFILFFNSLSFWPLLAGFLHPKKLTEDIDPCSKEFSGLEQLLGIRLSHKIKTDTGRMILFLMTVFGQ